MACVAGGLKTGGRWCDVIYLSGGQLQIETQSLE